MDALELLLSQTEQTATNHGMQAYIVGSKRWVSSIYKFDGYFDDGRLLKICPVGVPTCPLLEIEMAWCLRIYKHRNAELTAIYKGRNITSKWVINFIVANAARAADIVINRPISPTFPEPTLPRLLAPDEMETIRNERKVVSCSCGGVSENCVRCYGSGLYMINGFGNRV